MINPICENQWTQLDIEEHPLAEKSVSISLKTSKNFYELNHNHISSMWEMRVTAERRLLSGKYKHRLCYMDFQKDQEFKCTIVPYPSLPWYLDNVIIRKIYSIWKQATVLFRTIFPPSKLPTSLLEKEKGFWKEISLQKAQEKSDKKTGKGALIQDGVVSRQIVYPHDLSNQDNEMLVLYNYAPLQTGGKQIIRLKTFSSLIKNNIFKLCH